MICYISRFFKREDNRKFKKSTLWSYDNCGNILSKREAGFTLKPTDEIETFTDEKLYAYNGDKLLSFGSELLSYTDTNGNEHVNPRVYRNNALTWDYGRQLASFGENTFKYDGYGRRIKKNDTVFTYDANNNLIKQSDGTNTLEFIYDNSGISGVVFYGKTSYIYSKDVQGNIVGILDNSGHEVVQYSYDAWGNCKTTVLDEAHALIAELNSFRYRSYYYDTETHLYYLNTRYYDPEIGRFISQDDVSYLDPEHINGLNLFAYCGNNPVMRMDDTGNAWWDILAWISLAIVVIAVAVITAGIGGAVIGGIAGGIIYGAAIGSIALGAVGLAGGAIGGMIYDAVKGNDFGTSVWTWAKAGFGIGGIAGAIIGGAIGGAAAASVTGLSNAALWTSLGSNGANIAAGAASSNGLITIGQTFGGKVVQFLTSCFGYDATKFLWASLSKTMASTLASQTVTLFVGDLIKTTSVFVLYELPELIKKGIEIIISYLGG